jgi:glycosyltransferase involved in cell wall biosynthesis
LNTVTLGLCVKNAEETIGKSIESVLGQDYPHQLMEIIVVDGLSKDRTLPIVTEKLEKSDIPAKIYSDNGQGLGFARNIVCKNTSSKYVIWIDGDIIIPKEHVREQVDFMERNPRVGAAKASYGFSNTGNVVADIENMRTVRPLFITRKDRSSNLAGTGAAIFRLSALKDAGFFDEKINGAGEDIDIAIRMGSHRWNLSTSPAVFYEGFRKTWKGLWKEYYWWGYGMHYVVNKHHEPTIFWANFPPIACVKGVFQALTAFKLTRKIRLLLFPFHAFFKANAWISGFLNSHFDKYGHRPVLWPQFRIFTKWPADLGEKPESLPNVTVGICVRNAESTIEETLESLSRQEYPKELLEIIAVDDHSVDSTLPIMKEFSNSSPFKVRILRTHNGLGEARQIVVDNASGKYIVWIDGDITIPKNHIMDQVAFMEKQHRVAIAKGTEIAPRPNLVSKIESYRPLLHQFRWRDFSIGIGGATFLVRALKEIGGFDVSISGAGEDVDVAWRMNNAGWSTVITPAIFYHKLKSSWKRLWQQYYWYGYGMHFIRHKHTGTVFIFPFLVPFAFTLGFVHCCFVFDKTKEKSSFLLPIQYVFKRTAWLIGYAHSHVDRYGY